MKKLAVLLAITVSLFGLTFISSPVFAQTAQDSVCKGIGLVPDGNGECGQGESNGVMDVIAAAINILSLIVGIAAVIMIIVGGFKYVTSGGDTNSIGSAKSTITYAVVGLLVALFAQVLVRFVITRATADPPLNNGGVECRSTGDC